VSGQQAFVAAALFPYRVARNALPGGADDSTSFDRFDMRLFVVACLATLCDARCELWTSSICEYLRGFEVSDPSTRSSVCKGLCLRHRNCDAMCECIAQNYEATCECDIGDCGQQRQSMICDLGCPYLEDSCKALCSCLVETKACSP